MKYEFKEYSLGDTITEAGLPPYRLPDSWWRKPLVWFGIVKPLYRPGQFSDLTDKEEIAKVAATMITNERLTNKT